MLVFVTALSVSSTCSSLLTTFKTFVLCEFELCIFNLVEDVLLVAKKGSFPPDLVDIGAQLNSDIY